MPERVKLQEPGSELTMTVRSVKEERIEKNDYFLFANGSQELLVPQSSVEGQLNRLNVATAEMLVGETVRFSRSTKMSRANRPFWNLDLVAEAERSQAPQVAAAVPASTGSSTGGITSQPTVTPEKTKLTQLYLDATTFVLDKIVPKFEEKEIGLSDTAVIAAIATLFIAASKER